jgi:hypothetical protein
MQPLAVRRLVQVRVRAHVHEPVAVRRPTAEKAATGANDGSRGRAA